jgi:hypothetical protein
VLPEADTPTSSGTQNTRIDQLDPRVLKSGNQLHERSYVAADDPVTGLHALDRRHREACQLRYLPLIDVQERTSGPELIGGDHESAASDAMRISYAYTIRILASTINFHVQNINTVSGWSNEISLGGAMSASGQNRKLLASATISGLPPVADIP